ncbi:hypothetical protein Tco_0409738 [Tanacetum coccineum]
MRCPGVMVILIFMMTFRSIMTLVEESLNATDDYVSIQKVIAKVLWLEVEISNKWIGNNLKNHDPELNIAGLILQWFKNTAKNMVTEVQSMDIGSANNNSIYRLNYYWFMQFGLNYYWFMQFGKIGKIDQSVGSKLRDRNAEESWALLEDLALYDIESWNDPRDFAKPVKAIALPQDVLSTSDCRLIELKNQVQRLMEAHLAPTQPTQVNKVTTSCEICSGLHDTQYCMEDPEHTFVEYASSRTDEEGGYSRVVTHLFESMPVQEQQLSTSSPTSPSRITSSPSLSPEQHQPSPSPQHMDTEEPVPMPHDSPLHSVHSLGHDEGSMQQTELTVLVTKLTERVDSLESQLQQTK